MVRAAMVSDGRACAGGRCSPMMGPFGTDPTHGPDPARPEDQFESGSGWYCVMVLPIHSAKYPELSAAVTGKPFDAIVAFVYGGMIRRLGSLVDSSFKVLILRRRPPYWSRHGWHVVGAHRLPNQDRAAEFRTDLLSQWRSGDFDDAKEMSRAEIRQAFHRGASESWRSAFSRPRRPG